MFEQVVQARGCQIGFEPKNVENKQVLYNCFNGDQAISLKNPL